MQFVLDSILYSYSQIFFSNRRWFGAAVMTSTFVVPEIGLLSFEGLVISNFLALLLRFDKEKVRSGYYGFNGILFGAAAAYFFELTPFLLMIITIFIIITFFLTAALEHLMANLFNLPGLSLPFITTLYIFLIFITNYNTILYKGLNFIEYEILNWLPDYFLLYLKSFALILFQSSTISGLILVFAVLFFSRVMFVNSLIAFSINYLFVFIIFPNASSDIIILTSFNAILTSFALGGSLVLISRKSIVLIFIAVLMTIVFTGFFAKFLIGFLLPVLVLPFNFVVLSTIYGLKFRQEQSDLVLLYFQPGSAEENFYYHNNRMKRFSKFKNLFAELPVFGDWKISQGIKGNITHKDDWQYAFDFVITDENSNEHANEGAYLEDYYCFNTPVAAPLDGEAVRVFDNVEDNKPGEINTKQNWGNTIILDHGEGLFSSLSHLKKNSIKIKKGSLVKKGEIVGLCGNSGRSPTPHLHFQFQLTDKLGDKTYKFPLSHYVEKHSNKFELKTFDFPGEKLIVRNVESHKALNKAFKYQLGDKFNLICELNDCGFEENWEVKVDMLNNTYIESDNDAKAYLYPGEKVFYISSFIGNKKSALYYYYLQASKVPLGYIENLKWKDSYPVSATVRNPIRFVTEFFLIFGQSLESVAQRWFDKKESKSIEFIINTKLVNKGKGLLWFYESEGEGALKINESGTISSFIFKNTKINFKAKFKYDEA